jgi:predicted metal-binding membrane protein
MSIETAPRNRLPVRAGPVGVTLAVGATVLVAAACWVVAIRLMSGMDMGVATRLGSFGFFVAAWAAMMGAMMLPGAAPTVAGTARERGAPHRVPVFLASYVAVWTLLGVAVYELDRPHGAIAAGVVAVAAGAYELTPLKRRCRRRCQARVRSGFEFGRYCVGSSIGLMLMMVAVGAMSIVWMSVVAAVVLAQKLVGPRAAIDVPLAAAIVAFGVLVLVAPASIPGLVPAM